MSIPTLPEDVLEIIFDFVHDKNYAPTPESQSTFASLALVSKTFLPLARIRLYHRPVPASTQQSLALLDTLNNSPGHLGPIVRALSVTQHDSTTLLDRFLRLTPSLSTLILTLMVPPDGSKLLQALEIPLNIKEFKIALRYHPVLGQGCIASQIISIPSPNSVEKLDLTFSTPPPPPPGRLQPLAVALPSQVGSAPVAFPPRMRSFIIRCVSSEFDKLQQFLPDQANFSSLHNFELYGTSLRSPQLLLLLDRLPRTLASLSIEIGFFSTTISNANYQYNFQYPSIPFDPFRSLNSLNNLHLARTQGPSLEFLHLLASSCPHLVSIRFFDSKWISDRPLPPRISEIDHFDLVFPQAAIILALQSFENLRYIHLGTLRDPNEPRPYQALKNALEQRMIRVDWNLADLDDDDPRSQPFKWIGYIGRYRSAD